LQQVGLFLVRQLSMHANKTPVGELPYPPSGFNEHSQRFVTHLLASGLINTKYDYWVPISSLFIRKYVRQAEIDQLEEKGFIEVEKATSPAGRAIFSDLFSVEYRAQMGGRVGVVGGALQGCSREMKLAAFGRVPGLHNYDMKGSQSSILISFMDEAGIDASWLKAYESDPEGKYTVAAEIGISVDAWKDCLCALMMGATLPKNWKDSDGSIIRTLRDDLKHWDDVDVQVEGAYQRLTASVKGLHSKLVAWRKYNVDIWLKANLKPVRGKWIITGKSGMVFDPQDYEKGFDLESSLAAFRLQDQEAANIHALTVLSAKYGYQVLQNEHDGLIVLGEIPVEAEREAALMSGLQRGRLVQKDLADDLLTVPEANPEEIEALCLKNTNTTLSSEESFLFSTLQEGTTKAKPSSRRTSEKRLLLTRLFQPKRSLNATTLKS
jgi:predicted nucleotidyltransferase